MKRAWRWLLIVRWFFGATIFAKQIWKTRRINDDVDTFEEVLAWTKRMKADGWDDNRQHAVPP